ncbi:MULTISPECIES: hypothetical protein [Paenibacillus]|uniref:Nucleotidyltransferase family protein n=1 Tax=Paenibacillus xylanilyticus TaxID=248903 RepID=A0A7Y6C1Q7_9BACL|nr:hypothetical protein [Paenibacillus xylanilyticus]NUU78200.1 hypothetical protein [Paenibacillus xylanilyticus]
MGPQETEDLTGRYPKLSAALLETAKAWNGEPYTWLLGGSCGLLLQQVELPQAPRDIDVYADLAAAKRLHHSAPGTMLDEPVVDRTGPYASLLSHYQVGECALELVGGFEVWSQKSWYRIEIEQILAHHAPQAQIGSYTLRLMPLAHELLFNLLRGRADRYEPIANVIRKHPHAHQPVMNLLGEHNVWTSRFTAEVEELVGFKWT